MMMEEFSWALEFEKIKDKDDLNAIMEDSWFLSDNDLMARVVDLFEEETKPQDCAVVDVVAPDESSVVVPALESQRNNPKKEETVVSEKRKASSLVEETKPQKCAVVDVAPDQVVVPPRQNNVKKKETLVGQKRKASYAQRIELTEEKLQQSYARCKDKRRKTCLIGVDYNVPQKQTAVTAASRIINQKSKAKSTKFVEETKPQNSAVVDVVPPDEVVVPALESQRNNAKKEETVVGEKRKASSEIVKDYSEEQRKRQCVEKTRVNLKDTKSSLKETLQIPYAQRIELAKQKLKQSYARCNVNRKKTCLIGVNYNVPKNQCGVSAASRIINLKSEAKSIVKETKLSVKETKLSVKETLKIPYEQRVEMAKRKLEQQRRDSCKQQTCIIGVDNVVPKKPCHREIYKVKKVGTRLLQHHDLPVPRPTMRGY